jgi:hypothetical protein
MWGVRDHRSVANYGDAVFGVRHALPRMLALFKRNGIRATWATVGLLFARSRDEMLGFAPPVELRPTYERRELSPYAFLEQGVGRCESEDPWHFGRSLLDQVAETDGQEIATHTYSHYYCLERGATEETFSADLDAALAIAAESGHHLKSIVFPRNQMAPTHVAAAAMRGINVFRGNPSNFIYRSRAQRGNTSIVRTLRLVDGALPLIAGLDFEKPEPRYGGVDVPASRFLRPWNAVLPGYSWMHLKRIQGEMIKAAKTGRNYHLWWHPHNMGRNQEANFIQLGAIVSLYRDLNDRYGMESRNMTDIASSLVPIASRV